MSKSKRKPRQYNRITPKVIAEFTALEAEEGNGSSAVRIQTPTMLNEGDRAYRIRKKSEDENAIQFIDEQLQQIGVDAVQRVGKMVNSADERIATKNSHYVIDHLRGKAVQRTENKNLNITIESVLE